VGQGMSTGQSAMMRYG